MGGASSRGYYGAGAGVRSPSPKYGRGKKRRGRFSRHTNVTTQTIAPVRHHRHHHHHHRRRLPPLAYARIPAPVSAYPGLMPMLYNNYPISPYMMPLQRYQPLAMPQSSPVIIPPPSFGMPQGIFRSSPMAMPQQGSSPMFSAYPSAPYSTGVPLSTPYVQQPTPVPFNYNNIGVSGPVSTGMVSPAPPYLSAYQMTGGKLNTDWTGGGKISPGFLGPPI